jgi:2-methylcitrate dehydratase PrpD
MAVAEDRNDEPTRGGVVMPPPYTERVAAFLHGVRFEDLPGPVVDRAKAFLLDYIGYAVSATGSDCARMLRKVASEFGGNEEATMIGSPQRTSVAWAAMVNGALGHVNELDDTHGPTQSHPGCAVIPACLAIGERADCDGRSFLAAMVAGYDVSLRIGHAVMPTHYTKGWHPSGTIQTFGAAVAAGKLLGLTEVGLRHAMGLAGTQAAGNFAHSSVRGMAKDLNPAKAAFNGVLAALLAQSGFTGSLDILENRKGFLALYTDSPQPAKLIEALGTPWLIERVAHKLFPGCRHLHPARDAVLDLLQRHAFAARDVDRLTARIFAIGAQYVDDPTPWDAGKGIVGPHYSVQFQLALALCRGEDGLWRSFDDGYVMEQLAASDIRETMGRMRIVHDDALNATWPAGWGTIVEVDLGDGRHLSARVDLPRGEPENPLRPEEIRRKFDLLASGSYTPHRRRAIVDAVEHFEALRSVRDFAALLR